MPLVLGLQMALMTLRMLDLGGAIPVKARLAIKAAIAGLEKAVTELTAPPKEVGVKKKKASKKKY